MRRQVVGVERGEHVILFERGMGLRQQFALILQPDAPARAREFELRAPRGAQTALRLRLGARLLQAGQAVGDLLRRSEQRFIVAVDRLVKFRTPSLQIAAQASPWNSGRWMFGVTA